MAGRGATWKIVDKNMLAERATEEWEKLNQGGRAFQNRVESLLQRNEQWQKMHAGGREFQKGVEMFFKEQKPVRKFFERLVQNQATAQAVHMASQQTGKVKKTKKDKKDKHNLLGNEYVDLSSAYTRGKVLGQGGFGTVYVVADKDGNEFACKEINKLHLFESGMQDMAATEISVMLKLSGDVRVMDLRDVLEDQANVYMILDLCSGGDVLSGISKHFEAEGSYSEADAAQLLRMMLEAVQYCHSHGVVHRDIKPENFLWAEDGGKLKLADFGLAAFMDPNGKPLKDRCGTPPYMAPEMWKGDPYTTEPDVWSLGISLAVMLTGEFPFVIYSAKDCATAACEQEINWDMYPWPTLSADCVSLLVRMLAKDPDARITVDEALKHPWLREGGTAPSTSMTSNIATALEKLREMNELHEAALRLLAKKAMLNDEVAALRTAFGHMDTDGDGLISWQTLRDHASIKITKDDFVAIMRKVDKDQDGLLTFEDFCAIAMQIRSMTDTSKAQSAFTMFDVDGDGFINYDGMAEVLNSVGMDLTDDIAVIFNTYDRDGDGLLSFVEFGIFWQHCIGAHSSILTPAREMQATISTISTVSSDLTDSAGIMEDLLILRDTNISETMKNFNRLSVS